MAIDQNLSHPTPSLQKLMNQWKKNIGKHWKITVQPWDKLPFQWRSLSDPSLSEGSSVRGWQITFSHRSQKEQETSQPYEDVPKKNVQDKKQTPEKKVKPLQFVCYWYSSLRAGYRYSMFERVHPDIFGGFLEDGLVIFSSPMKQREDHPDILIAKEKIFKEVDLEIKEDHSFLKKMTGVKSWSDLSSQEKEHILKQTKTFSKKSFYFYQRPEDEKTVELEVYFPL